MLRVTNPTWPSVQVVQAISFTILNDSKFEARSSWEAKRWQQAMRLIQSQGGWVRTLFGRDINVSNKVDIYIGMSIVTNVLLLKRLLRNGVLSRSLSLERLRSSKCLDLHSDFRSHVGWRCCVSTLALLHRALR